MCFPRSVAINQERHIGSVEAWLSLIRRGEQSRDNTATQTFPTTYTSRVTHVCIWSPIQYLYLLALCSNCCSSNFSCWYNISKLNFQVLGCEEKIFLNLKSFKVIPNIEVAIKKVNFCFLIWIRKFLIFINRIYIL